MERLRKLYEGHGAAAQKFRYGLLIFDLATLLFVIGTSFLEPAAWMDAVNVVLGLVILADFLARLAVERPHLPKLWRLSAYADAVAVVSFLAPIVAEGFGFLRVLRTLRLLHTYQLLVTMRQDFPYFRRNEEVVLAIVHLTVFLLLTTGLIYALQVRVNPEISNYADALYFTVTALTTTGFGDITLVGTSGRMLSVAVMIVGVTLFLRLAQVLFRPPKVRETCQTCGLSLHDADAVHCKHCGETIRIETEGAV
jgi:voltage-gated potassium channel